MGQKEQAARAVNLRALALIQAAFAERKSSGMTQELLAADSGIPRSTLANILSTTAEPRLVHVEQLVRVALALGEDPRVWIAELESIAQQERPRGDGGVGATVTPFPTRPAPPAVQKRAARRQPGKPKMGEE